MENKVRINEEKKTVGIVMGSYSDFPIMKEAAKILKEFGINYEINIVSAHRTPTDLYEYGKTAVERGIGVIIAGAGGAAHLPGMMASLTALPVIGVPVKTKSLKGIDSLLSIVQMPKGVPVATVAIDGAANAGLLAVQILGVNDSEIMEKIISYKKKMEHEVMESRRKIEDEEI